MTNSVFKSLTLRSRIYLSTGVLFGVCCVASGIGWFGQTALLYHIDDYEKAELTSSRVLEIDRNVQELKAKSEHYIHSGSESARRAAAQLLQALIKKISKTQLPVANQKFTDLLDEMTLHLRIFGEQLALASTERAIRSNLVNEQLPSKVEEVQEAIRNLKESMGSSKTSASETRMVDVAEAFGEGQMHLLQYLINPDADRIDKMLVALKRAETLVLAMETDDSARMDNDREQLLRKMVEVQQLSLRTVQATRGYLYYSNVVMAGEISEFVYYSNQVKHFVDRQQQLNRLARADAANRTRTLSIVASLAAMLFAALAATGLSYSIIHPVSLLTNAFRQLADGETMKDIPGTERNDEIGRMSRAARVFSAKNKETKDLLYRSQTLSNELAAKAKALEETNLELDNFAYVASHDLKAPLRGIKSLAEWVHEDCEPLLPEDSKRHLSQMHDRVEKMQILLDELLEYSRVGRLEQQTEIVDLEEMVRSIFQMIENRQGVEFRVTTRLPRIHATVAPLKQVLLNLITNAFKYNDKGDEGVIEVSCEDLVDAVQITVADNGIGIDPRYHERVFQMYQRIAPKGVEGNGMGLAIVKKQVEYYGGIVVLESELNHGAKFTFTWPNNKQQPTTNNDGNYITAAHGSFEGKQSV